MRLSRTIGARSREALNDAAYEGSFPRVYQANPEIPVTNRELVIFHGPHFKANVISFQPGKQRRKHLIILQNCSVIL